MQHNRTETDGTGNAKSPPGSSVGALFSTIGAATFISLFAGVCYYYTLHYREAYLGKLGLDPAMLPITMQEAIAKGFEGIVLNVLWVVAVLAVGTLAYIALAWAGAYLVRRLLRKLGISIEPRTPHPALTELGRNEGFRISFVAALIAIGITFLGGLAAVLVGGPADAAGVRDAEVLRKTVKSNGSQCARYELKGGRELVGWRIGSTADRQFVFGNDNAAHIIKFDDLERLNETSVPCRTRMVSNGKRPKSQ